jgi:sigma-70-like protein
VPAMATLDDLNDRERAILQLLLKQRKSYDEIADLLKTSSSSVQSRAQEAVCGLGPDSADVGDERRRELADHLLGQQSAAHRAATREYLEDSAAGRSWARTVAGALRPLAGDALPEIPAEAAEVDAASDAPQPPEARQEDVQRKSQLGTKVLFAAGGLAVAVVLILVLGIFSGDGADDPKTAVVTRTTPTETPNGVAEGVMRPPAGSSAKASGQMGIVQYPSTNRYKLLIAAKGLSAPPAGSAFGVWLFTSKDDLAFVGFPKSEVAKNGELQVVADLSPDTRTYREVLVTHERSEAPKAPGEIVLRGVLRVATAPQTQTQPTQTTP